MNEILKKIIRGNIKFARKTSNERYKYILDKQTPKITLVMCSDSRYNHNLFGFETTNQIFTIENIGNQIKTAEGSVEYGVLHLKTPVLMILGHTGCGAIKASLGDYNKETKAIKKELNSLKGFLDKIEFKEIIEEIKETKYAEYNVDMQVEYAVSKFRNLIDSKQLTVVGAMFDFYGIYGSSKGELYIVNVDGITDMEILTKMVVLKELSEKVKKRKVKRLN